MRASLIFSFILFVVFTLEPQNALAGNKYRKWKNSRPKQSRNDRNSQYQNSRYSHGQVEEKNAQYLARLTKQLEAKKKAQTQWAALLERDKVTVAALLSDPSISPERRMLIFCLAFLRWGYPLGTPAYSFCHDNNLLWSQEGLIVRREVQTEPPQEESSMPCSEQSEFNPAPLSEWEDAYGLFYGLSG